MMRELRSGFTLIELLVVMAIIAVALGVSLFGIANSRRDARDNRRKADLENIRSALEIYRSDCGVYPPSLNWGGQLAGSGTTAGCSASNIYMEEVPQDVISSQSYFYNNPGDGTYLLCAALEGETTAVCGSGSCGGVDCTYSVANP